MELIKSLIDNLNTLSLLTILTRVILAVIIGGIIGLERGIKSKSAGLRTNILVCLGSTMVMMTNQYIYETFGSVDPTRMGAQVVSGIGFLGAGTILVTRGKQIRGLTTAAGLWVAACLGLAIGIGFYSGAIIGGISVLLTLTLFDSINENFINRPHTIDCYIIFETTNDFYTLLKKAKNDSWSIIEIETNHSVIDAPHYTYEITFQLASKKSVDGFIEELNHQTGILFIKEV